MKLKRLPTTQICCEEPFRLFFPAGLLLGMAGVSLWPAYYAGVFSAYPGTSHARLMIQGFMASFIIGFLGTAGPRITSTRKLYRLELLLLLTLDLLAAGLHVGGADRAGDAIFALCLLVFLVAVGTRFLQRNDSPPPNFALVGLGLLNGLAGSILLAVFENAAYSRGHRIGAAFLEQGFVLLPILGVAPFLLPRLLDVPRTDDLPESRALPPGWIPRALFAAVIGLAIDATFVIEAFTESAIPQWLRLAAIVIFLTARMQRHGRSFLGDWLRVGIIAVVLGFVLETIWPLYRLGALHLVFIGGFSLIVLTVAIRVVFGHSGNEHLFRRRLPFFVVAATLIFLAAVSRYVADLSGSARVLHLVSAAVCWLVAALIWMGKVLPKVVIVEAEE